MIVSLTFALVLALVGSLPVLFARVRLPIVATVYAVLFVIWTVLGLLFPFQSVGPFGGDGLHWRMFWSCLATCVISMILRFVVYEEYAKSELSDAAFRISKSSAICAGAMFGLIAIVHFPITGAVFHSDKYRGLVQNGIEQGDWGQDLPPIDPAHLRQVSQSTAIWKGNKALSQVEGGAIGSRFRIGEYYIQRLGSELVWIAPLEYQGFLVWQSAEYTPGFVIVSAEDPNREPRLVSNRKMRFLDSAYFGDNLWRHVVTSGYVFNGLKDPTFEVDEDGNPFWVYTRYEYSIGYGGPVPVSALVVNPETGEMVEYSIEEVPAWIDRIMPAADSYERLVWYGKYVHGWVNSVVSEKDAVKPTDAYLSLVWTGDGRACWFTGMTSTKRTDNALVSIMLMDSRTGATREYRVDGAADEEDVLIAVGSSISNYEDWFPTQPIPENIYGRLAWIVPVTNASGVPQRIAIVNADASKVALGETVGQALAEYRRRMNEGGAKLVAENVSESMAVGGVVERFASDVRNGNAAYLIVLTDDDRVFSGTSEVSIELPLVRVGEAVTIRYEETTETVVQMTGIDIDALALRVSDAQVRANTIAAEQPLAEQSQ